MAPGHALQHRRSLVTADADGGVTFLNAAAQYLTGWTQAEAAGAPLEAVFRIINEESRKPVKNPAARALGQKGDWRRKLDEKKVRPARPPRSVPGHRGGFTP